MYPDSLTLQIVYCSSSFVKCLCIYTSINLNAQLYKHQNIQEISVAPGEEDNGGIWDGQLYMWYVPLHIKQSDKAEVTIYSSPAGNQILGVTNHRKKTKHVLPAEVAHRVDFYRSSFFPIQRTEKL